MRRLAGVLLLLGVSLFGALTTGVAIYYHLAYALALLLGGGLLWCVWNLLGVAAHVRRRSYRAQVGGHLESHPNVWNRTRFPKGWLIVRELGDLPGHEVVRLVDLKGGGSYTDRVRTPCYRRGLFTVGPVQIESWDPLGLFRLRRRFSHEEQVLVYPATVPLPHLHLPLSHLPGDEAVRRETQQLTPLAASVREYMQGDGLNRIHWPTTARTGKLMVKEFDQGLSTSLWLLLDLEERVQVEEGEDTSDDLGVTIAASVAQRYLSLDVPVGLSAHGDGHYLIRPDPSPTHLHRILEALARAKAQGTVPLAEAINQAEPYLSRYNTLLVITPSTEGDWPMALVSLSQRGVSVVVVIVDPQSYGAPRDALALHDWLTSLGIPTLVAARGQPLAEALALPFRRGAPTLPARAEAAWR